MAQQIRLVTKSEQIHLDVIAKLEDAIEKAKAGTIVSVAIAAVYEDGSIGGGWSRSEDIGRLIGSIASLQFDVCQRGNDER